jgi:primosomal protein N' (replication factor Y)
MSWILSVWVQSPRHANLSDALSYQWHQALKLGQLVRVPMGARHVLGLVVDCQQRTAAELDLEYEIKPILSVYEGLAPLSSNWINLVKFASSYYQRSQGEMALSALPAQLRTLRDEQIQKKLKKWQHQLGSSSPVRPALESQPWSTRILSSEQQQVLKTIATDSGPFLLFGQTGSGKTEVYLQAIESILKQNPLAQVLIMVPEINLTPQLMERVKDRFKDHLGAQSLVCQHSAMTPSQRLSAWLAAHQGQASIVLGTRMSIFMSLPRLAMIVVDEEHDASYKQQEGSRYSARDLAIYRSRLEGAKVLLGSATPSLESWFQSGPSGKYQRLFMSQKIGGASHAKVIRVDMNHQPRNTIVSAPLLEAIKIRLQHQEQSILLLNRRGYAPIIQCNSCGWMTQCNQCSAYKVFHKLDRSLRCHHCGHTSRVPSACPVCSDQDLGMVGIGTQKIEEHLAQLLTPLQEQLGRPIRIQRVDADSTKSKNSLEQQLLAFHSGEVDILVGTQMIAKGHDFRRVSLVAAIDPDAGLFSSDFRAPERLFALLMQAGGRAGRDGQMHTQIAPELWVQTKHPKHRIFNALKTFDYEKFASDELQERAQANMPPFSAQALIRAEGKTQEGAQLFLLAIKACASELLNHDESSRGCEVFAYSVVPMALRRVANIERAQMLLESPSKSQLQHFLSRLHAPMQELRKKHKDIVRWAVDVDPQQL